MMNNRGHAVIFIFLLVACSQPAPNATPTTAPTATAIPSPTTAASPQTAVAKANPLCPTAAMLEDLVACITLKMPRRDSNGYAVPSVAVLDDARQIAAQMLAGRCDDIALASLKNNYSVASFTDKGNNTKYCVMMEVVDQDNNAFVDRGWGTFIVNNAPSRELNIQAPHPLFDLDTEAQAIGVFKGVGARTYLVAGAHRDANKERTTCEPDTGDGVADASHNSNTIFQSASQAIMDYYNSNNKNWVAIQFHGKATTSCPGVDAFMTYGSTAPPKPGEKLLELKANVLKRHPNWVVTVPGDAPPCTLNATDNVTGRLYNNVPATNVCPVAASIYTGRFIHIEQNREQRTAADWIPAILDTWP